MKITAVTTVVVNAQMRNWVFVKVSTDEGVRIISSYAVPPFMRYSFQAR